jgi:membrane-associated phospholipid phosphatase
VERGPLPTFGQTVKRDVHDMWGDLWHDTKAVYGNPYNLAFLGAAGGVAIAVRPEADDDIEDHYRHSHTFKKGFRDTMDWVGSPATGFIVAGGLYLAGQTLQQDKTYEVGKRLASALIITDLSTLFLKGVTYTHAPNRLRGAFPSGHVSSTMALATVLNDAYGPLVGVPMYTLTAFVGWQRLDSREHHLSDVLFGAALGWVVAEQVVKEHRPEIFGGEIVPYCDPESGSAGIAWLKALGN